MGINRIYKKNQIKQLTGKRKNKLFSGLQSIVLLREKERKECLKEKSHENKKTR
jgi:hypothetical protein